MPAGKPSAATPTAPLAAGLTDRRLDRGAAETAEATPAASSVERRDPPQPARGSWLESVASDRGRVTFWLNVMFGVARRAPWLMRGLEPICVTASHVCFRRALRDGPWANSRWLLGPGASDRQRRRLVNRVIRHFYRFVNDIGSAAGTSPAGIRQRIREIEGRAYYDQARAQGRGVIFVTAHLGAFEVGIASIAEMEPGVHVVFQRDTFGGFDAIRDRLHRKLGVIDAPAEDGVDGWMRLRDVLQSDGVVLMQGDRVMPGQRGVATAMMGGHVRLPLGPIKLAALSGAPILPVFSIREADGRSRVVIEPAIEVDPADARPGAEGAPPPLTQLAAAIEKQVRAHPEQWLMLSPMWEEDRAG